ncbi:hypothetical protein DEO72_LG2g5521 [Vigna unguiculata]|uniref:Uncharacterized protein n=1 Tax=Vigna unguiculata TaxID=3917 RepID=A0A4D6L9H8_VIGUN|nr:hypothetical protein DEO72_LG2g5521 [Vigna unguiculata]
MDTSTSTEEKQDKFQAPKVIVSNYKAIHPIGYRVIHPHTSTCKELSGKEEKDET